MPPEVTIMLPAKDAAATLGDAARSCLNQSFRDLELVLIAHDPTPETFEIMIGLSLEDARVRVARAGDDPGFIPALNVGWGVAKGRLLARMDSDDLCHPDRIKRQVEFLDSHPEIAACGTSVRIRRRGPDGASLPALPGYLAYEEWLNSLRSPDEIAAQRFIDSPVANPSTMVRREVFEQIGGYREVPWAEDYDFWLRLLEAGLHIGKVAEILLDWVDSESRLTRNDEHYTQERFLEAKAHFLARVPAIREHGVGVCGAGPIGKRLARLLRNERVSVHAFYEVSNRRIGNRIGGVLVRDSRTLPPPGELVPIAAVGLPGARERIRDMVTPLGYTEGQDFFCVA